MKRAVITGIAVISPAGNGKDPFWNAITTGNSCIKTLSRFCPHQNGTPRCQIAAEIEHFAISDFTTSKIRKYMDRAGAYAVAAAIACLSDANFDHSHPDYEQLDLYLGTCCGAQEWVEQEFSRVGDDRIESLHPHTSVLAHPGNVIGLVTIVLGFRGRGILLSNLDLAGTDALECAVRLIQSNLSKRVLVGATDAPLTPLLFGLFDEAGILSHCNQSPTKASRPFDRRRDGLVLAEGAAMLLIEEYEEAVRRGSHIYAEILGCATVFDNRLNGRLSTGEKVEQGQRAISQALQEARLTPQMIGYIHADGSSLPEEDKIEAQVLKQFFGKRISRIPVSSSKSVLGHGLSVSGLLQSAACALACNRNSLPPLFNREDPDPDCDLNFVTEVTRPATPGFILQNTQSVLQHRKTAIVFGPNGK